MSDHRAPVTTTRDLTVRAGHLAKIWKSASTPNTVPAAPTTKTSADTSSRASRKAGSPKPSSTATDTAAARSPSPAPTPASSASNGRLHGQPGRVLGSAPRAPVRRDQLRRAARWDGAAEGHAGLAGRRVDEPGARDASLSAGPRRGAGLFVLFAGREDLVQGGSGGSAAGLRLSDCFLFRTYV